MTNLTTRIQARIAQDRAMLAAGTQGTCRAARGLQYNAYFCVPLYINEHEIGLIKDNALEGTQEPFVVCRDESKIVANATLIAACVNNKEGELLMVEGLLGMGCIKDKVPGENQDDCDTDYQHLACKRCATLARWIERRGANDGKA